jgi:hypothetical protein
MFDCSDISSKKTIPQPKKEDIESLTKDVHSLDLDNTFASDVSEGSTRNPRAKRLTLEEIKEQFKLRGSSTVSFVIIGTTPITSLINGRPCRCRKEYPDGTSTVRSQSRRREDHAEIQTR